MPRAHLPQDLPPYREAIARGDFDRAVVLLRAHTKTNPGSANEALLLADLQRLRGEPDEAISILSRLRLDAEAAIAVRALLQLALLELGSSGGSLEEAASLTVEATTLTPINTPSP